MKSNKLDFLLICDGISIFFIVFYHELGGLSENFFYFLRPYLVYLGLTLFTFSSGYKMTYNHWNELNERPFLGAYFLKRCIRLYKPYLGYSILMLFPLSLILFLATIFHLEFEGVIVLINDLHNVNFFSPINFLLGKNPIAGQLWYLIALIGIFSVCFTILLISKKENIFFLFLPFSIISFLIMVKSIQLKFEIVNNIFLYLPFFIFGGFWAYNQIEKNHPWFHLFERYCPYFFFLLIGFVIVMHPYIDQLFFIYFLCLCFPFFIRAIYESIKQMKIVYHFLIFCGMFSFQIFLFHWPLVLPILSRSIKDILKIDFFFIPLLISIIAIYASVYSYKIVKKMKLNRMFE